MFKKFRFLFLFFLFIFFALDLCADPDPSIKFIQNKNQWHPDVLFSARIPGGNMVLGKGNFSYYFLDQKRIQDLHEQSHDHDNDGMVEIDPMIDGYIVSVNFIGSNKNSLPQVFGQSKEYYNFFLGKDQDKWASQVYAYQGAVYPSFYSGIDLKVYGYGNSVKYDFIVAPYADPAQIKIDYTGEEEQYLDNGDLTIKTQIATIIEKKPIAWQYIDGKKVFVRCEFLIYDDYVKFYFPDEYDPCYELVIDPLLIFSTYSGSAADNWGSTATPGENGTLYSAGVTNHFYNTSSGTSFSGTFPTTPGAFQTSWGGLYDIGILKYDSAGSQLLFASYLGGSSTESPHSLVVNKFEELIVLGTTGSNNFPATVGAFDQTFNNGSTKITVFTGIDYPNGSDIVVSRISRDGTKLMSSTFLGGSDHDGINLPDKGLVKNYGDALRGDVITDMDGNVYISSVTASKDFPVTQSFENTYQNGGTDALVIKLDQELSKVVWGGFIGGEGLDAAYSIKLDKENNIIVAGGTTSAAFPVSNNSFQTKIAGGVDGWIAKISASGDAILNCTFTGTTSFDQIYFIDLNTGGEIYAYGQTSGNFYISPGVYNNPNSGQFIQKFDNSLSKLEFSTVFGSGKGVPDISPTAFLVNDCNNLYLAGWGGSINERVTTGWATSTFNLPVTDDAFQKKTSGHDFYLMVLSEGASRLSYATFMGGIQSPTHVDGGTSRFDKNGVVYHAVCSGCGGNSDFPTTTNALSKTNNSLNCNNAAFKFDLSSLNALIQANQFVCIPDTIIFENASVGGVTYNWNFGDGVQTNLNSTNAVKHLYKKPGQYKVRLIAFDGATCQIRDSTFVTINVFDKSMNAQNDDTICENASYQLSASGATSYEWKENDSFLSDVAKPIVQPRKTTQYFLKMLDDNGCITNDTVTLSVIPKITPRFETITTGDCEIRSFATLTNLTDSLTATDRMFFDFGDGSQSDNETEKHTYANDGTYRVKLVGIRDFCSYEKIIDLPIYTLKFPNIITPADPGLNDKFMVQYGPDTGVTPATHGIKTSLIIYNRWGTVVYQNSDYQHDWSGEGFAPGVYYYEAEVENLATCKSWLHLLR